MADLRPVGMSWHLLSSLTSPSLGQARSSIRQHLESARIMHQTHTRTYTYVYIYISDIDQSCIYRQISHIDLVCIHFLYVHGMIYDARYTRHMM